MTTTAQTQRSCFGTFVGKGVCESCPAHRHCKALLLTNGFDLVGSMLDQLVETMPEGEYPEGLDPWDKDDATKAMAILVAGSADAG